ncbi:hypothetical protein [Parabacteroides merdae]|uniref:hypothetical protein n=1 Tax=Parabacteroides merdae TaxID=46503 RepID=UPI001567B276|nr:hypothetical protein [Parabacteroides merdae]
MAEMVEAGMKSKKSYEKMLMDGKLKNAKQELYWDMFLFCIFTFVALTNVYLIINKLQTNNRGVGNGLETTCLHHFA